MVIIGLSLFDCIEEELFMSSIGAREMFEVRDNRSVKFKV